MRAWFNEYEVDKCLNTSSSGVRLGEDSTELKIEFGVLSNG